MPKPERNKADDNQNGDRRVSTGGQVDRVATLAINAKTSVDFCGYWQRAKVTK